MFSRLVKHIAEREGVTEHLKAYNQMEWVARMNNIRSRATEIVNHDIIYNQPKYGGRERSLPIIFFEKINLCVTFYIACASIYQNSKMMVWLWYSVVYNLSLYLCRYSSGATILYPIN